SSIVLLYSINSEELGDCSPELFVLRLAPPRSSPARLTKRQKDALQAPSLRWVPCLIQLASSV
ncbi:MAG: hypothetical protein MJD61_13700, partial [Proteobacteria bacterium]|nr:hypothetical protein [Pseudomonadota bacterium]